MNDLIKLVAGFAVVALILSFGFGFAIFNNTPTLQSARADAIKTQSQVEAEAVKANTQARIAQATIDAKDAEASLSAWVTAKQIAFIGSGIAVALFAVGVALSFVAWAMLKASTIQPNAAGQFPLVKVAGFGFVGFVDPNRSTGLTVFKTPTPIDQIGDVVARLKGQTSSLNNLSIDQPLALSEAGSVALAGQASAVAMTAAATRYQGQKSDLRQTISNVIDQTASPLALPLPAVATIDDASHIERLIDFVEGEYTEAED